MDTTDTQRAWGRGRLLGLLAVTVTVAVLLAAGLGYGVWQTVTATATATAEGEDPGRRGGVQSPKRREDAGRRGGQYRDRVAARVMLPVPEAAARPPDTPPQPQAFAGRLEIPDGGQVGPAGVMTGYPRTPAGAVAQLAAIEVRVLQQMDYRQAVRVHRAWALPGGATAGEWRLARTVEQFLDAAGMGRRKAPGASVTVTPAAGLVKGSDGPRWTVACVLVRATGMYRQQARVALGYCERMQWAGGRWLIAPGEPPAVAPSTWPGTQLAHKAGWLGWTQTPRGAR